MRVYLDTSALVKRYLPERNSEAFDAYFSELAPTRISRLTLVELRSTFARKRRQDTTRRGFYTAADANPLLA